MWDESWVNFREEAYMAIKNREETLIKKWLESVGYKEPIGYYRDSYHHIMEIYTKHPGWLIGKGGADYENFKQMLAEEFGGEWGVKFIEVRGGFVSL